jgi:hypothetical protein
MKLVQIFLGAAFACPADIAEPTKLQGNAAGNSCETLDFPAMYIYTLNCMFMHEQGAAPWSRLRI